MSTIQEYIDKHQLEVTLIRVPHRPENAAGGDPDARHWVCSIKQVGKGNPALLTTFYTQGSAHTKAPKLADVLDCLKSDANCVVNARDFEEFAGDLGYDPDSRRAEAIYHACEAIARDLERLLGREALRELLEEVEGL